MPSDQHPLQRLARVPTCLAFAVYLARRHRASIVRRSAFCVNHPFGLPLRGVDSCLVYIDNGAMRRPSGNGLGPQGHIKGTILVTQLNLQQRAAVNDFAVPVDTSDPNVIGATIPGIITKMYDQNSGLFDVENNDLMFALLFGIFHLVSKNTPLKNNACMAGQQGFNPLTSTPV